MPLVTFTLFPDLPIEIRRIIWKLLLPHRVVELDFPDQDIVKTSCKLYITSQLNSRPPLITRVSREARTVAFENGGWQQPLEDDVANDPSEWYALNLISDPWMSPNLDTIHMNHWLAYDPIYDGKGNPLLTFLRECKSSNAEHASFDHHVVLGFDGSLNCGDERQNCRVLEARKKYRVCLKMISIHMSRKDAAESRLFGILGEERLQVVDALDNEDALDRFRQLWLQQTVLDEESATHFKQMGTQQWEWDVRKWREDLKVNWLRYKWEQRPRESFEGVEEPKSVRGPNQAGGGMANENPIFYWELDWVKEIVKSMPDFRPAIMFRLCPNKCHQFYKCK